jgi:hypothetical protein
LKYKIETLEMERNVFLKTLHGPNFDVNWALDFFCFGFWWNKEKKSQWFIYLFWILCN